MHNVKINTIETIQNNNIIIVDLWKYINVELKQLWTQLQYQSIDTNWKNWKFLFVKYWQLIVNYLR